MIIGIFRSQYLIQYFLLFLLTLILWSDAIIFPEKWLSGFEDSNIGFLQNFVVRFPMVAVFVSILLVYLEALMLNVLAEENRLTERNQMLTAALYILMVCSIPEMARPNLMLIVNLLMIILLQKILKLYGRPEPYGAVFDTGLMVGLSSLLFLPTIYFTGFILMSLMMLQIFKWREWIIPFIGVVTPYIFLATWYFWKGELSESVVNLIPAFSFRIPDISVFSIWELMIWIAFILVIVHGFVKITRLATESTVDIRKKFNIVLLLLFFSVGITLLSRQAIVDHMYLVFIPLVIFAASYLSRLKKLFFAEIVFALIFLGIIIIKVLNFS